MGIATLPSSLPEALDLLVSDPVVSRWMSPLMLESYVAVKRMEHELTIGETVEQTCERYRNVYGGLFGVGPIRGHRVRPDPGRRVGQPLRPVMGHTGP